MAYPDGNINTSTPADNNLLAEGDDAIRLFKRQMKDRLNSVFVDADADPMVLKDNAVATAKIQNLAVTTGKIADDAVTNAKIADDAVNTDQLADGAVDSNRLATNAVTSAKIADNAVTTSKIPDDAVTGDKIADGSIGGAHIANLAVSTGKIQDDAVTSDKIADDAVGAPQIANGAVGTDQIADGSVTPAKLSPAAEALLLEKRSVDVVLADTAMGSRSTTSTAAQAFTGLDPNDMLVVSLPTQFGDLSDASQRKLIAVYAVAYTDQFVLVRANPNDGALTCPGGTYRVHCIKPATDW